ncbi:HNH endonuclease signature motif containing protein [Nocardioides halotolerans]|uniref:HNH endonuclease signature motif containing protein n=1 Tax=Nocardioides halotolerans TaxID=433660 RepID=UPI0004220130|nr:HNH endonuclease signature motif containing protein [Nocardioides halotolerans]
MDAVASPTAVLADARVRLQVLDGRVAAGFSDDELLDGLAAIQTLKGALAALEARLLVETDARDLARKRLHWGSTSDWFTHLAGLTRREGRRAVVHALQLVTERPETLSALHSGHVSDTQAAIICDAVDVLPSSPALRARGEQVLLDEARRLNATDLARTARHLADVVDPDRTERRDEAALAREERAAHAGRFLSVTDDGAGGVRIKGRGSAESGAVLRAALLPLTRPAPAVDPDAPGCDSQADPRDHGARMFDALVQLAQHALDTDQAPASHGARPRVAVTIDYRLLATGVGLDPRGEACTDDGLRLSVAAVRRLACDADVVPVCLGSDGEVLDVGRSSRLVTAALWRALVARDRHCTFPGCTRPPVMCHAHHVVHWVDGGTTCLDNLVLVCGAHHSVLHHSPWQVRLSEADGRPEFLPPRRLASQDPPAWIRHRPRRE